MWPWWWRKYAYITVNNISQNYLQKKHLHPDLCTTLQSIIFYFCYWRCCCAFTSDVSTYIKKASLTQAFLLYLCFYLKASSATSPQHNFKYKISLHPHSHRLQRTQTYSRLICCSTNVRKKLIFVEIKLNKRLITHNYN